jgi:plasmid stabilization system protein ParE
MIRSVRFDPAADEEIDAAQAWYEGQRPALAADFLHEMDAAVQHIAEHPAACVPVPDLPAELEVRRFPVHRFPYWIVFLVRHDEVRVIAVAHQRRHPDYWRDRLDDRDSTGHR